MYSEQYVNFYSAPKRYQCSHLSSTPIISHFDTESFAKNAKNIRIIHQGWYKHNLFDIGSILDLKKHVSKNIDSIFLHNFSDRNQFEGCVTCIGSKFDHDMV